MIGNRDFGPDADDALIGPDQKRGAHSAHEFSSVQRLLLPYAIRFEHFVSFVRCQCDRELVLGFEAIKRRDRIGRDAQYLGPGAAECAFELRKIDGFAGAAAGIGAGIKVQNKLAFSEVGQLNHATAVPRQAESRRFGADGRPPAAFGLVSA